MAVSIRGDKLNLRILRDGQVLGMYESTDFQSREESQISDTFYLGAKRPEIDKSVMGWSGSFSIEVKNAVLDEVIADFNESKLSGAASPSVTIVITEEYDEGDMMSFVYTNCVLMYDSHQSSGVQEKIKKGFSFKAENRIVQ